MNKAIAESTSGKYRFDRLNHIHSYDGEPLMGTSTVVQIVSKGSSLQWWASRMACEKFGFRHHKKHTADEIVFNATNHLHEIKGMDIDQYMMLLKSAYHAHKNQLEESAAEGVNMHGLVELYIKAKISGDTSYTVHPKLRSFDDWAMKNVRQWLFSEAHCYNLALWVGGICDLAYIDMDGNYVIGDVKNRSEYYITDFLQIAGYAHQIFSNGICDENGKSLRFSNQEDGVGLVFSRHEMFPMEKFSAPVSCPLDTAEMTRGFINAVALHKLKLDFEKKNKLQKKKESKI